jgi:pimeloyl-ACP methyl ester carboxylesterase
MWDFQAIGTESIPSTLLWGSRDTTFPPGMADPVHKALGENSRFHLIENAGHAMHYEFPNKVNPVLLTHLVNSG